MLVERKFADEVRGTKTRQSRVEFDPYIVSYYGSGNPVQSIPDVGSLD